ncbi:hypothetical protein Y032_0010g903 [Ancylostoma ceylanicum]|uniref:RNase H type-1 domain-containing protein n=1 Tax=Ancylostoma ceylanicum TaxID=53326 RepID=A0A016VIU3_9BILA|nr:hypothetical protein Y032_0010g903 [Ancylostoma ceylanicum]
MPILHKICHEIIQTLHQYRICLVAKWIPREMNWEADIASRRIDLDDWGITHSIAEAIQKRWGAARLYLFATSSNKKCEYFIKSGLGTSSW